MHDVCLVSDAGVHFGRLKVCATSCIVVAWEQNPALTSHQYDKSIAITRIRKHVKESTTLGLGGDNCWCGGVVTAADLVWNKIRLRG